MSEKTTSNKIVKTKEKKPRIGGGFNILLGGSASQNLTEESVEDFGENVDSMDQSQNNDKIKNDEIKTTMYLNKENYEKINALAFWKRETKRELINDILEKYILSIDEKIVKDAVEIMSKNNKSKRRK
ncbi:hypothetical protein N9Y92_01995 [Chlamydiales bacterium]|nr:hypothetical protein [Chlamydiales bacterium]